MKEHHIARWTCVIGAAGLVVLAAAPAPTNGEEPGADRDSLALSSTLLVGGSASDRLGWLRKPLVRSEGVMEIAGTTEGPGFPTTADALDASFAGGSDWGREDIVFARIDVRSSQVLCATHIGGAEGPDFAADIQAGPSERIVMVGKTGAPDFPTTADAVIPEFRGPAFRHADGFLAILGDAGRTLEYSTFIGGSGNDWVDQVFVDPTSGELTLFGTTDSRDFPLTADIPAHVKPDPTLFALRLDPTGRSILAGRLVINGWAADVVRDREGFLVVATTTSSDLPIAAGAADESYNGGSKRHGGDLVLLRLSGDLEKLSLLTYLGGQGEESWPQLADLGPRGLAVVGRTTSSDLPVTPDAAEREFAGEGAVFLARLSRDGTQLPHCTFLGGQTPGGAFAVNPSLAFDGESTLYVAGGVRSGVAAFVADEKARRWKTDLFVLSLDLTSNQTTGIKLLAGSSTEFGPRVVVDAGGELYLVGETDSGDFPGLSLPGTNDGMDIFISRLSTP